MTRIEQEQSGLMLMDAGTPEFSSFSDALLEDSISPEDVNEVLQQLEIPVVEDPLNEDVSLSTGTDNEDPSDDSALDLSAGESDKALDPVRLYMREMGIVPLLKREQEVSIAKRIEWGQKRAQRAISRSPIAVAELIKIGEELEADKIGVRDVVIWFPSDDSDFVVRQRLR